MLPHIIMSSVDANRVELLLETLAPGHDCQVLEITYQPERAGDFHL